MISEEEFHIRPAHNPPESGNAAVAVPVNDIAQDIQAVGIPETGRFQQPEEGIQGITVKIGCYVMHIFAPVPEIHALIPVLSPILFFLAIVLYV